MSIDKMFPGKDVVYTLTEPAWNNGLPTGAEKILYIGTNFEASRDLSKLSDPVGLKHRVYVDNELMFEACMALGGYEENRWVQTFDLIDELEKELEEAKDKLVRATGKLVALGQR